MKTKLEKQISKIMEVETRYLNPVESEDFLYAVQDSEFLILKESGELIVDLLGYVSGKDTPQAAFEDELFLNHIYTAIKLLDNGVDLKIEKLNSELIKSRGLKRKRFQKAFENLKNEAFSLMHFRNIELRFVGIDAMIQALGIEEKVIPMFHTALELLYTTAVYTASVDLAEDRGHYKYWDFKCIDNSDFLSNLFNTGTNDLMKDETLQKVATKGMRNTITIKKF